MKQVKPYFMTMVYAKEKQEFDDALILLKSKIPAQDSTLVQYVDQLSAVRKTFAKYLLREIEGSLFLVGSSCSEANHSSIISYLRANTAPYKKSLESYACDLFSRQKEHCTKLKMVIARSLPQRAANRSKIQAMNVSQTDKDNILYPAIDHLNFPSFSIFLQEYLASESYLCEDKEDMFSIRRIGVTGKSRLIPNTVGQSRCNCWTRKAQLVQCRHEICAYKLFLPAYFQRCHQFREDIPTSINIGDYRNCYSILQDEGIPTPDNEAEEEQPEISNQDPEDVLPNQLLPPDTIPDDDDSDHEESKHESKKALPSVTNAMFKHIIDQLYRGFMNNKNLQVKEQVYANACQLVQIITEVDGYTRLKQLHEDNLLTGISSSVAVSRIGTNTKKRLKPIMEVVKKKSAKRCAFCRVEGHVENNCTVKRSMGRPMTMMEFNIFIHCDCPYRQRCKDDIIKTHLPTTAWYISVAGVVLKSVMLCIDRLEWKDIALEIDCTTDSGHAVESGLYDGETVESYCKHHGKRIVFIKDHKMMGELWTIRK